MLVTCVLAYVYHVTTSPLPFAPLYYLDMRFTAAAQSCCHMSCCHMSCCHMSCCHMSGVPQDRVTEMDHEDTAPLQHSVMSKCHLRVNAAAFSNCCNVFRNNSNHLLCQSLTHCCCFAMVHRNTASERLSQNCVGLWRFTRRTTSDTKTISGWQGIQCRTEQLQCTRCSQCLNQSLYLLHMQA